MPILLRCVLSAEMAFFACAAVVLMLLEERPWSIVVPVASALPIVLCAAYWRRFKFADVALRTYCLTAAAISAFFVVLQYAVVDRVSMSPQNVIMMTEAVLLVILYGVLKTKPVSDWYKSNTPRFQ